MTKKKSTRKRRKKPAPRPNPNRIWLILLCLAGGLGALLIWVAIQDGQPVRRSIPPVAPTQPAVTDIRASIEAELDRLFDASGIASASIKRDSVALPLHYTVSGSRPAESLIEAFRHRVARISADTTVDVDVGSLLVSVAGEPLATVIFMPISVLPAGPLVAIVMDDLGRGTYPARVLLEIDEQITFSILPGEADAKRVAQMGYAAGHDILLHAPMEPQGYPEKNPGEDSLFIRHSNEEIKRRFEGFLQKVPHVVGSNNHMGSRFTEDRRAMTAVIEVMRERGLFFIDSVTSSRSVAAKIARDNQVPVLRRDVFLDNVADVELIAAELQRLVARAKRNGQAIGLCHPYPETLEALQRELPRLARDGVTFVSISTLLKRNRKL